MLAGEQVLASDAIHKKLAYELKYQVQFDASKQGASVVINVDKGELLKHVRFNNTRGIYSNIRANGKLIIKNKQVTWELPTGAGFLRPALRVRSLQLAEQV